MNILCSKKLLIAFVAIVQASFFANLYTVKPPTFAEIAAKAASLPVQPENRQIVNKPQSLMPELKKFTADDRVTRWENDPKRALLAKHYINSMDEPIDNESCQRTIAFHTFPKSIDKLADVVAVAVEWDKYNNAQSRLIPYVLFKIKDACWTAGTISYGVNVVTRQLFHRAANNHVYSKIMKLFFDITKDASELNVSGEELREKPHFYEIYDSKNELVYFLPKRKSKNDGVKSNLDRNELTPVDFANKNSFENIIALLEKCYS